MLGWIWTGWKKCNLNPKGLINNTVPVVHTQRESVFCIVLRNQHRPEMSAVKLPSRINLDDRSWVMTQARQPAVSPAQEGTSGQQHWQGSSLSLTFTGMYTVNASLRVTFLLRGNVATLTHWRRCVADEAWGIYSQSGTRMRALYSRCHTPKWSANIYQTCRVDQRCAGSLGYREKYWSFTFNQIFTSGLRKEIRGLYQKTITRCLPQ